jgi:hypothetical protein
MGYGVFPFADITPMSYDEVGDYIRSFQKGEIEVNSKPVMPRPPVKGAPAPPPPPTLKRGRGEEDESRVSMETKQDFIEGKVLHNLLKVTNPLSDGSLIYVKPLRNFTIVTHFSIKESRKQRRRDRGIRLGFVRENSRKHTREYLTASSTTYHFAAARDRYFTNSIVIQKGSTDLIERVLPKEHPSISKLTLKTSSGARATRPESKVTGDRLWRLSPKIVEPRNDYSDLEYDFTPWSVYALCKISENNGVRDHFFSDPDGIF